MANSLLEIQPHVVSRDLRGYSVLMYGQPKSGKTTTASKFPGALLLAFEKGYNALAGIKAQPINSWAEFIKVWKQLKNDKVKEMYETIIIDTADIAYSYCEKYICNKESDAQNSYEHISDFAYGKGYKLAQVEFDEAIRKILQLDYGLVLISHSQDKTFKDEQGTEFNQIIPTLDNKARLVCERTCDIIGYSRVVDTEDGPRTKLFLRQTPRFVAGSRFKYIAPVIDFSYDNLVKAIGDAVDKEAAEYNNEFVTDERVNLNTEDPVYDFEALKAEFQVIVSELMEKNQSNGTRIQEIISKHLGPNKRVVECTPDQAEMLDLIIFDLKHL